MDANVITGGMRCQSHYSHNAYEGSGISQCHLEFRELHSVLFI